MSYCCDAAILDGKAISCAHDNTNIISPLKRDKLLLKNLHIMFSYCKAEMEEMAVMECQDLEVSLAEMVRLERKE